MKMLHDEGIEVHIWRMPVEIPNPIPFDQDQTHASYDRDSVERFWQILLSVKSVFDEFRSRLHRQVQSRAFFLGQLRPGGYALLRPPAPERPGADPVTREAYSHEVSSVGFWPGAGLGDPAFYSYAAPEPEGFSSAAVRPKQAHYDPNLKEFILMYEDVRLRRFAFRRIAGFLRVHLRRCRNAGALGPRRAGAPRLPNRHTTS